MGKQMKIMGSSVATNLGPPERSRSDFFLPPRPAKSLNAAKIKITGTEISDDSSSAKALRAKRLIESMQD
jgi:hypothetical protein